MFRNTLPDTERPAQVMNDEPIPLSVLALDLAEPGDGWTAYLAGRGIKTLSDDIGREAVSRGDAKVLLDEQRALAQRRNEMLAAADAAAEQHYREWRAELFSGIPADAFPEGARPAEAMLAAARGAQPRRESVLETALSNRDELVFHPHVEMDE